MHMFQGESSFLPYSAMRQRIPLALKRGQPQWRSRAVQTRFWIAQAPAFATRDLWQYFLVKCTYMYAYACVLLAFRVNFVCQLYSTCSVSAVLREKIEHLMTSVHACRIWPHQPLEEP